MKPMLAGNAAIRGKYVWTNMAAIKDGSMKRMIFPPCPMMFIPFWFLRMFVMMGLLWFKFPGTLSPSSFVLPYEIASPMRLRFWN
jgi:hypothetical protein